MAIPNDVFDFLLRGTTLVISGFLVGIGVWAKEFFWNARRPISMHSFFASYLSGALLPVGVAFVLFALASDGSLIERHLDSIRLYLPIAGICLVWVGMKTIADNSSRRHDDPPRPRFRFRSRRRDKLPLAKRNEQR